MILILSQGTDEDTTELVMDWLEYFGVAHVRLNGSDIDSDHAISLTFEADHMTFLTEDETLSLAPQDVRAVWFRRWQQHWQHEMTDSFFALESLDQDKPLHLRVVNQLNREFQKLSGILFDLMSSANWLSHPSQAVPNKLRVLQEATRAGLETPATIVTSYKQPVQRFAEQHGSLITKAIGEAGVFPVNGQNVVAYTAELMRDDIESMPDRFFPSLFQEQIHKEYEIRVFYLEGKCYSMAILSQRDQQTKVDFRQYNHSKPNRSVPYRLPLDVLEGITHLMSRLELETGSLDLIRTPDGRHVFLEVNPVGQFGMVSYPCNYGLERKVAECLIRKAQDEPPTF